MQMMLYTEFVFLFEKNEFIIRLHVKVIVKFEIYT